MCFKLILHRAALDRQNEMIMRAQRTLQETEDLATNEIIPTLADNRDRLVSAQAKVIAVITFLM